VSHSQLQVRYAYPKLIAIFIHSSVTGANRGLGLEFVKQYSQDSNVTVLAYQRSDDRSAIEALKKDNVKIIKLDAADDEQVKVSVGSGEVSIQTVVAGCNPVAQQRCNLYRWIRRLFVLTRNPIQRRVASCRGDQKDHQINRHPHQQRRDQHRTFQTDRAVSKAHYRHVPIRHLIKSIRC
jgi:hypothetical protein